MRPERESAICKSVKAAIAGFPHTARFLVCISGGADSIALLHAMHFIAPNRLEAVNCNFHLRGDESERDSDFVKKTCRTLGVPIHCLNYDAKSYATANRISEEMACRELRYRDFRRLKKSLGCARIVVAHNADDNIETLFLNLFRGTGIKGLCGMAADDGEILRPLITTSRAEIEVYLNEIGATHIEDSSNRDDYYKRNFIRLNLLPLIESKWPGARKAIAATINNLEGSRAICDSAINDTLGNYPDGFLPVEAVDSFPAPRALLHAAFADKGISSTQLKEMEQTRREGASWTTPSGSVRLTREGFRFYGNTEKSLFDLDIKELEMTDSLWEDISTNRDNSTIYLPDNIGSYKWTVSNRGMTMKPFGMKGRRKIADMLRDARIPHNQRENYPILLEEGSGEVVWLPCIRRSDFCKVTSDTKFVTRIRVIDNAD